MQVSTTDILIKGLYMKTVMTIKDTCEFYNGTGFPMVYQGKTAGKYPFYKVGDISKNVQLGNCYLKECDNYIDDEILNQLRGVLVPANSIAFAKIGEALKLNRRTITSTPCLVDNNVIAIHPNEEILDVEYFYYFMKTVNMADYSSSTTVPSVKKSSLEKIGVPTPELNEQKRISNELNTLSFAIQSKKDELSSLDELVKSRFIEMFGDIDLSPQKSEWTKLSDLGTIYTGTTPSTGDETNWDGSILWITPAEMNDESFFIDNTIRKITEKGMKSKSLSLMPVGTVLLSTRAPIGKVGIVAKPMTCNQGFKNFYSPDKLNSIFLYVVLKNNTQYLNAIGTGTTFKEISKTTCGNIRVPVPPIELQNEFAKFVKLIDKSKFIVQQQIKDLQELLDSKMDEYFR